MFINPKVAIEKGWIIFPSWMTEEQREKCVQPDAIDWVVSKIFKITTSDDFIITENNGKRNRQMTECYPEILYHNQFPSIEGWWLSAHTAYDIMSDFYVNVPEKAAAILVIRSSLSRNGCVLSSGIFDSSFKGNIGATLHNHLGPTFIERNMRIAQIAFISAESAKQYQGQYNRDVGIHWTSEASSA